MRAIRNRLYVLFCAIPISLLPDIAETQSAPRTQWSVASKPTFDTRRGTSSDTLLLDAVDVIRLPDGSIVVGDNGAKNIKWFAADGRLLRTIGREGDGPGEFRLIDLIGHCGDRSVLVYDGANQRLTALSPEGRTLSTRSVRVTRSGGSAASAIECGHATRLAVLGWPSGPIPNGNVAYRTEVTLTVQAADGTELIELGSLPSSERQRFGNNAGPRPLGKRTIVAVGKERMFVGAGEGVIQVFTLSGRRLPSIQVPFAPKPITQREILLYIQNLIDKNPRSSPARLRATYEALKYPDFFPAHGAMLADEHDRLWIERYRLPNDFGSMWTIVGSDGQVEAEISLPDQFRAREVGADYVLGTLTDDDVVHVVMYRIVRSPR